MPMPTPEEYNAACILERWATGEEGDRRETSRRIILDGGMSAQQSANYARASVMDSVRDVQNAIDALGLQ